MKLNGTEKEFENYKTGIQKLEELFSDFNEKECSDCKRAKDGSRVSALVKNVSFIRRGSRKPTSILRLETGNLLQTKECGCCSRCAAYSGYFKSSDGVIVDAVNSLYYKDPIYGYFDIYEHKCSLPRGSRSEICLTYCCDSAKGDLAASIYKNYIRAVRIKNPRADYSGIRKNLL